jgi:hypothetical protein
MEYYPRPRLATFLQKRHFEFMAKQLRESKPPKNSSQYFYWRGICQQFSASCEKTNYNYNYDTFLTACGYYD